MQCEKCGGRMSMTFAGVPIFFCPRCRPYNRKTALIAFALIALTILLAGLYAGFA